MPKIGTELETLEMDFEMNFFYPSLYMVYGKVKKMKASKYQTYPPPKNGKMFYVFQGILSIFIFFERGWEKLKSSRTPCPLLGLFLKLDRFFYGFP